MVLEKYFFEEVMEMGELHLEWGINMHYSDNDSQIDYAFSLDWAVQTCHTISYAFNFKIFLLFYFPLFGWVVSFW